VPSPAHAQKSGQGAGTTATSNGEGKETEDSPAVDIELARNSPVTLLQKGAKRTVLPADDPSIQAHVDKFGKRNYCLLIGTAA